MPTVHANGIDINYEVQGEGEPMVLIPYLAADQACYAFQVADYAKHFTCFSVDLRGAGLSSKPEGTYTTELLAEDIAGFMQEAGIDRAHVFGLSLGAAVGMWVAARHPDRVKIPVPAQRLGPHRPLPARGGGGLAGHGRGPGQRDRDGDQGDLPLVLHPGVLRRAPGVHRLPGRLCAGPSDAARRRLDPAVGGGPVARRASCARRRSGAHAGHLRAARRGDVYALRGSDPRPAIPDTSSLCSRTPRTPPSTRTPTSSTAADPGLPAAPLRVMPRVTSGPLTAER